MHLTKRSMMTFVSTHSEGLTILPTHRVVNNLRDFSWSAVRRYLEPWFATEVFPFANDAERAVALEEIPNSIDPSKNGARHRRISVGECRVSCLLSAHPSPEGGSGAGFAGTIAVAAAVGCGATAPGILEPALGLTPHAVASESNLSYEREFAAAIEAVDRGAQVAFLLNPVDVDVVMKVATSGEVMPQKSTDFYPKLLSGITMYCVGE